MDGRAMSDRQETEDMLNEKDARITELEDMINRMVSHGDRCNWFADRGDEQIRHEALVLIGSITADSARTSND